MVRAYETTARVAPERDSWRSPCERRPRDRPPNCGITVREEPEKPDLAVYSQLERFGAGVAPSWDSPDIFTNSFWPWTLLPEVRVRVRNLSGTAAAANVLVHLHRSRFGLGGERMLESTKVLSLAPQQEQQLFFALGQAALGDDQRIGVHASIEHPHDPVEINDAGSQVTFGVRTSEIGRSAQLTFPVRNPLGVGQHLTLAVLANDVGATVAPASRSFLPLEETQATLAINVPGGLGGPGATVLRETTVVARGEDGALIDGLTYLVFVDS